MSRVIGCLEFGAWQSVEENLLHLGGDSKSEEIWDVSYNSYIYLYQLQYSLHIRDYSCICKGKHDWSNCKATHINEHVLWDQLLFLTTHSLSHKYCQL